MKSDKIKKMTYLLLVFLEIGFLFILSRIVSKTVSRFLSIHVLSFLFLPGVIVHELSHWLIASILFVRVGEIEFKPKIEDHGLKLGSVAIAKTDPIRRAIIGFAPIFVGLIIILGAVHIFTANLSFFWSNQIYIAVFLVLGIFYILFVVSNTMFSSKADMEGTLELSIVFLVIFIALYFTGFRFPDYLIKSLFLKEVLGIVQKSSMFLLVPIAIDLAILGGIKIFRRNEL